MRIRDRRNTRPAIFPVTHVSRVSAGKVRPAKMLDASLSACLRHAQLRLAPVFPSVSSPGLLRISRRALSFSLADTTYIKRRGKKKTAARDGRRLMETSYREIARSSLDTTVAETGYANEQLTGPRERRLLSTARKNHRVTQIEKYAQAYIRLIYYTL